MDSDYYKKLKDKISSLQKVVEECPDLVYAGHPALRTKAEEVDLKRGLVVGQYLCKVLQKHREISGVGRGLAAPQIGESVAVFVTYVGDVFKIYINPRITQRSVEQNLYREGCLSCAPFWGDVKRSSSITIEYTDEKGDFIIEKADGFLARLLQHEYDHLEGILNIDISEARTLEVMIDDPTKETLRPVGLDKLDS